MKGKKFSFSKEAVLAVAFTLALASLVGYWAFGSGQKDFDKFAPSPQVYVDDLVVKDFKQCVKVGGALQRTLELPVKCYYEGVVYIDGNGISTISPIPLKNYADCVAAGGFVNPKNSSCEYLDKTFYYDGPYIESFKDCMNMGGAQLSNPPTCGTPDGRIITGPSS